MTDLETWEALCRRCGQCCFEKWVDGDGTIHPTKIPCRFLDLFSRECTVYEKRFDVGEGCVRLTQERVEVIQWLPDDCAYVRKMRGEMGEGSENRPSRRSHRKAEMT
ncbi:MAG TPA: hypothetical protein VJ955_01660 [Desulfuromonadales bacterium]|nr:hypothetical protein [Desulfuromonadales bacterium]